MKVVITCDSCEKTLQVPDTALGKKVRCPACKNVFQAKARDEAEERIAAAPAPRPSPTPARPAPPPLPSEPADETANRDEREPIDFPVLKFFAAIKKDPDKELKGQFSAELGPDGLTLKKKKQRDLHFPVGTRARYLKGNRIELEIDDRMVEVALAKLGWYCQRLARDVASFLRGKLDELDKRDYGIPWYLFVVAFLPIGIPAITLGGAIWGALAGGLIGANFTIVQTEKMPMAIRLLLVSLLSLAGYLTIIVLFFVLRTA